MLLIIGGGKMGSAIVAGLLDRGTDPKDLTIVETNAVARTALGERFAGVRVVETPIAAEGAVIAVKPKEATLVASDARDAGAERLLSIAAGVTLAQLHEAAGNRIPVVRAMPNIGALVECSATAICASPPAKEDDVVWAQGVLAPLGTVVRVKEDEIDAVTGLSGSGPAYLFLVAEALIEAGVEAGLPLDTAQKLVTATFQGASQLLRTENSPLELRQMVTTPAGTTAAAVRVLEARGVRSAFIEAVIAAAERSREIGRQTH